MLGGVGRRALAGTENPEAKMAASDQPSTEAKSLRPSDLIAPAIGAAQSAVKAGKVKSIKLKIKMKAK